MYTYIHEQEASRGERSAPRASPGSGLLLNLEIRLKFNELDTMKLTIHTLEYYWSR